MKQMANIVTPEAKVDTSTISIIASMIGMILVTLALGGVRTYWIAAFAVVAVGIAQLFQFEMLNSRISPHISRDIPFRKRSEIIMTGRLPAGIAGIALGVLSLFGVLTRILLPISAILFGLALALGSWAFVRLSDTFTQKACDQEDTRGMLRAIVRLIGMLDIFIGCGSIALGILALTVIGVTPVTLTLVATFGIGFSCLLSGTIFSGRVLSKLHCTKLPAF